MRRVSMATRDELVGAVRQRYLEGGRAEKARILDEFVAVSGFHRMHAVRLLRKDTPGTRSGPRPERRIYGDAVREALIVLWEASDRICGKRLKTLIPILVEAMERHGHLHLTAEIRTRLLAMSAATIRSRASRGSRHRWWAETPSQHSVHRAPAQRSDPNLFRLAGSSAWLPRCRPGCAQRTDGAWKLHTNALSCRHRERMDGMRALAGA